MPSWVASVARPIFWRAVSDAGSRFSPYKAMPWAAHLGDFSLDHSPGYFLMDMATRLFSPYL